MQPTQLLVVGWQYGVADFDAQSAFDTQPTHVLLDTSHTGRPVIAAQSELATHSTQVFVSSLHTGVAPEQNVPEVHWTQVCVEVQAGVGVAHSPSLVHATQTFASESQTGNGALHPPEHGTCDSPATPAIPAIAIAEEVPPAPAKTALVIPPLAPPLISEDSPPVEERPPTNRLS